MLERLLININTEMSDDSSRFIIYGLCSVEMFRASTICFEFRISLIQFYAVFVNECQSHDTKCLRNI